MGNYQQILSQVMALFFCLNFRKEVFVMCYFQGKPVGEYCACCRNCAEYLCTCSPVVSYGGYVCAECDFDFCSYCPNYGECEEIWGKEAVANEAS